MTDTKIPSGISAQRHPCWELVDPETGLPHDDHGDGIQHFGSAADAQERADDLDDGERLKPREMDTPCWIAVANCGWKLDDELPMVMHHVTAEEALRAALDNDMRVGPKGGLICSPDCGDCADD